MLDQHNCTDNTTCFDTEAAFVCDALDECSDGSHNCDPAAVCTNTFGSFTCECSPFYSGDGVTCTSDCSHSSFAGVDTSDCDVCILPTTNTESEINVAFEFVTSSSSSSYSAAGATVCLGSGEYSGFDPISTSSGINIPGGGTVRGVGNETVVTATGSRVFYTESVSNVTVSGMRIVSPGEEAGGTDYDGTFAEFTYVDGLALINITVEDAHANDEGAVRIYWCSGSVVVSEFTCTRCYGSAVAALQVYSSPATLTGIRIIDNYSGSYDYAPVNVYTTTTNCPVTVDRLHVSGTTILSTSSRGGLFLRNNDR